MSSTAGKPSRQLNVFDSVCLMVGIIVGVGIYEAVPLIARSLPDTAALIGVWVLGGALSLAGALCYAELASAYPEEGGDYVYLRRAYGEWAGYLFAWSTFLIIRPGSIAAMAFPFGDYMANLWESRAAPAAAHCTGVVFGAAAVTALTLINCMQIRAGKWTQNILTSLKVIGLIMILGVAFFAAGGERPQAAAAAFELSGFGLALILVLFTYGGWNEIAYVAAEVREPQRNILRALVLSVALVTVLYVLVNALFVYVLGYAEVAQSHAVASDTVGAVLPAVGPMLISVLISLSALGAINGLIFSGARVSYAFGRDHRLFGLLGKWSSSRGTPVAALLIQGGLSLAVIIFAGSFGRTVVYTTAVVWLFFFMTGLAVFVLRKKDGGVERPYRVWAHPITTLIFCVSALYLAYSAFVYDWKGSLIAVLIMIAGLPVYWLSEGRAARQSTR
jgi:basic amino acid/polyamine antiporter, APA family